MTIDPVPTWGDASDLIELLDVRPDGERSWIGMARPGRGRAVVEGSQMLAQAIVAAGRLAPRRRAVSASMMFVRAADTDRPLRFDLDVLSDGRTFTAFGGRVEQDGRLSANGSVLCGVTAPDVIRHAVAAPDVAGPDESDPYDMGISGRDVRIVDAAYSDDSNTPVGPPVIDAWVRYRDVPDDPVLHAALLAQLTGHMSIAAALRPHAGIGQERAHRTLSTAINAISLSFHREVRADRWMLYHHLSSYVGDGMTHSECRVHDEGGELLASFTVDAMVRNFGAGTTVDERRSL